MFRSCLVKFVIYCVGNLNFLYIHCWLQLREDADEEKSREKHLIWCENQKCAFPDTVAHTIEPV